MYVHVYAQDDLRVNSRLTLNLGLRYEYSPWLSGYRGQVGTFDPNAARPIIVASDSDRIDLDAQFAGPTVYALFQGLIQTSSQAGLPLSITHADTKQLAPRLGFAWRPFGDATVVRGGYGIFYEQESSVARVNNNMVPFRLDQTSFNDQTPPVRTMADFFLGTALTTSAAPTIGASAVRAKMGRDHHFSLGVQQEIAPLTVLEVNYVGNLGSRLDGTTNINFPQPGAGGIQARRPYPLFGAISYFDDNMSNTYHSLQTSVEQRSRHGLWYLGVVHVLEEHHHAEHAVGRGQHGTGKSALELRRAAQHRAQRGLRAADRTGQEASSPARGASCRRCSAAGRCRASTSGEADGRSHRPFPAIARTPVSAVSGRTGSAQAGSMSLPSRGGSTRRRSPSRPNSPMGIRAATSCARTVTRPSMCRSSSSSG